MSRCGRARSIVRDAAWRLVARVLSRNWAVRRLLRWTCVNRDAEVLPLGTRWEILPWVWLAHIIRAEPAPGEIPVTLRAFVLWGHIEVMGPDRTLIRQYGSGDTVLFRKGTVSQVHGVCESRGALCLMVRYG